MRACWRLLRTPDIFSNRKVVLAYIGDIKSDETRQIIWPQDRRQAVDEERERRPAMVDSRCGSKSCRILGLRMESDWEGVEEARPHQCNSCHAEFVIQEQGQETKDVKGNLIKQNSVRESCTAGGGRGIAKG